MLERAAAAPDLGTPQVSEVFRKYGPPRFAMDVLRAALMDPSGLDCRDILEARYQLRDELSAFRIELKKLQFDFTKEFGADKVFQEGRAIADARLVPRLRDIEAKARGSRLHVLKRLIEALEKPNAYVPLVGSLFAGIPLDIAIGISLGLISARVGLEALEEHRSVANDGLFYLLKIKERITKSERKFESTAPVCEVEFARPNLRRQFLWPEDVVKIEP